MSSFGYAQDDKGLGKLKFNNSGQPLSQAERSRSLSEYEGKTKPDYRQLMDFQIPFDNDMVSIHPFYIFVTSNHILF
ncbi:MAG: hypothetical protein PHD00_04620 [Bacteroidales bacterium]|nr:hypothetical protein [Bacteroidales bacterium]MDY0347549.1 hypothetical protein [Tenuifilaceae bacterium]